jgi:hypothetical protein
MEDYKKGYVAYSDPEAYLSGMNQAPTQPKETGMNKSLAILIANDSARLVPCRFGPKGDVYWYKTLDPSIKVDDLVIVQTDNRYSVAVVIDLPAAVIDPTVDNGIVYKWIVAKFDDTAFKLLLAQEQKILDTILNAQLRKKRREIRAEIMDGDEELKALPLVEMGPVQVEKK